MRKKIILTIAIFAITFSLGGVLKICFADSSLGEYLWGGGSESDGSLPWDGTNTNLGWISMGGLATDGSSYGVTVPDANVILRGYAWSENVGWIDFGNNCTTAAPAAGQYQATSCTTPTGGSTGVMRSSDNLTGWARIVSIAQATATGNSGGWQGWISMSGTATDGSPYGVEMSKMIGRTDASSPGDSTYAYSDEFGWIDFSYAKFVPKPTVSISASPWKVNVIDNPNFLTTADNVTLTWTSSDADTCDISGGWTGSGLSSNGTQKVSQTTGMNTYTIVCNGVGGSSDPADVTVYTYCNNSSCASGGCNVTENIGATSDICTRDCSNNSQCTSRSTGDWMEVAP